MAFNRSLLHCTRLRGPAFVFQLENPKANWLVIQITWTCFFWPHISSLYLAVGSINSLADFIGITCDVPFYLLGLWCFCKEKTKPKSFAVLELVSCGASPFSPSKQTPEHPLLPHPTARSHPCSPTLPTAQGMLLQGPKIQQALSGEPEIPEQAWPRAAQVDYGTYSRT